MFEQKFAGIVNIGALVRRVTGFGINLWLSATAYIAEQKYSQY